MTTLIIKSKNETDAYISGPQGIIKDIAKCFEFRPEGYLFMPSYKVGAWDGIIRPVNAFTGEFKKGLINEVLRTAESLGHDIQLHEKDFSYLDEEIKLTSIDNISNGKGSLIEPYDYQTAGAQHVLDTKRCIITSPTGSGKSLLQYLLVKSLIEHGKKKILILVPTVGLVSQLKSDFKEYAELDESIDVDSLIHSISSGSEKDDHSKKVYISTWQSVYAIKDNTYFEKFDVVFVDECHKAKGKSLVSILEKSKNATIKAGFTGTLEESKLHKTTLIGLFGDEYNTSSIDDLMQRGILSKLLVRSIILKHKANVPFLEYKDELDYLVTHPKRNKIIMELATRQKGNTLILFQLVKSHGKPLYEKMKEEYPDKDIYLVYGGIKPEERERIRKELETKDNAIILASYQTFQEGINIKKLHNVIFASPSKSRIRVFQSLGRGLRTHSSKAEATLYDIADDLRGTKKTMNHTLKHFKERLEMYIQEDFKIKFTELEL